MNAVCASLALRIPSVRTSMDRSIFARRVPADVISMATVCLTVTKNAPVSLTGGTGARPLNAAIPLSRIAGLVQGVHATAPYTSVIHTGPTLTRLGVLVCGAGTVYVIDLQRTRATVVRTVGALMGRCAIPTRRSARPAAGMGYALRKNAASAHGIVHPSTVLTACAIRLSGNHAQGARTARVPSPSMSWARTM